MSDVLRRAFTRPEFTRDIVGIRPEDVLTGGSVQVPNTVRPSASLTNPGQTLPGGAFTGLVPEVDTQLRPTRTPLTVRGTPPALGFIADLLTGFGAGPQAAAQQQQQRFLSVERPFEQAQTAASREAGLLSDMLREQRQSRLLSLQNERENRLEAEGTRRFNLAQSAEERRTTAQEQANLLGQRRLDIDQQRANQQLLVEQFRAAAADARLGRQFQQQMALLDKRLSAQATLRPPTANELSTYNFLARGVDAEQSLRTVEDKIAKLGVLGQTQLKFAPNVFQTQEGQIYNQAARQFTEARLRKESGAAIPQSEFDNDARTYFAQPGDTPQTLERKRAARLNLLTAIAKQAGNAIGPGENPLSGLGVETKSNTLSPKLSPAGQAFLDKLNKP